MNWMPDTIEARSIERKLLLQRCDRDARRLPTKEGMGTREYLFKLLREYREVRDYYRDNPPVDFFENRFPSWTVQKKAVIKEYLDRYREKIITEIRRIRLWERTGHAPAYRLGTKVWFPAAFGYSVVVFGEYRDGEGWSYVYSHPFESGVSKISAAPAEVDQ